MDEAKRPTLSPTRDSERFWEGCRRGELLIQRCSNCGQYRFYPRLACAECLSTAAEWVPSTGRGQVYSYSVVHHAPSSAFQPDCPYVLALIDLDEGVRLLSRVVDCAHDAVRVGMSVRVVFNRVVDEMALPEFRPE